MGIGSKIKEYRNKAGLTQKDLADQLHVTYQAVSRWENDDAEPSFDMLKDMCSILNCSTDDLFGIEKKPEEAPLEPQVVEKVIIKEEQKPVLGVCESCNKPIFEADDLFRIEETRVHRSGRRTHHEVVKKILCKECNEKRLEIIRNQAKEAREREKRDNKIRRIHSFIWPSIFALLFIILGIVFFTKNQPNNAVILLVIAVTGYTFFATLILNNTFIAELWEGVASWGFVRMPGIIFSFSFDGLVFLIATKILLFILSGILAVLAAILATILAFAISLFVYPYSLYKNIKNKD